MIDRAAAEVLERSEPALFEPRLMGAGGERRRWGRPDHPICSLEASRFAPMLSADLRRREMVRQISPEMSLAPEHAVSLGLI